MRGLLTFIKQSLSVFRSHLHPLSNRFIGYAPIANRLAFLVASQRSAIERCHNEQPRTDQQGQGDTADDRANVMPAIGSFGPGSRILRCCDTHPEVTHTHRLPSPTFVQVGYLDRNVSTTR
jgi:hypothetical protein